MILFFQDFAEQFRFVFLEGNRYKLIFSGLKTTILVSLCAVLLGVVIGMVAALLKLLGEKRSFRSVPGVMAWIGHIISYLYIDIIRGTPSVVQLLIMYFIVFKSSNGLIAGICTFGINSGAYVAEIIRAGILAVDHGQMEAGRSLGFSYAKTMRYIIIPQAIKNILPALGNEFIVLVKETAILGYVSIQDLTKASDFITSRTYTLFMPLIGCALIYYLLIKVLTIGLNALERRLRQSDTR
ncbi:MAG: amino acid ABC transporter permease [Lachnospiraceae bacterium]